MAKATIKQGGKKWMQKAVKNPGALRAKAGVTGKQKISFSELNKLAHSSNPLTRKQANLARTFRKTRGK